MRLFTIVSPMANKTPGEDKNTCMPIKLPIYQIGIKSGFRRVKKKSNPFQFPFIQRRGLKKKTKDKILTPQNQEIRMTFFLLLYL